MPTDLPDGYIRPKRKPPKRDRLSIRGMLAIVVIAAATFALIEQVTGEARWLFFLAVPSFVGSLYGAIRKDFQGILEGAFWGLLMTPFCIAFLYLVFFAISVFWRVISWLFS
mgnify:CR=1 FL=1